MASLGYYSLVLAFILALYSAAISVAGAPGRKRHFLRSAENSATAVFGLLSLVVFALLYHMVRRDFQIEYVANYTSKDLPLFYTISALWGGQKGSLLLWAWLLGLFSIIVLAQNRGKNRELMPYVNLTMMSTTAFFLMMLLFSANPFEKLQFKPADGRGLNPLLQNPGMIFHPPTLYLGYVGFTVPFAFAIAALMAGQLGSQWIKSTRRWTIFSWYFLAMGILFGAQWSYVELGWGGYWAWDPVENASIMPWLTGTAFLHSMMIQEKKDMLKVWNLVLIVLTFALSILGTFITRSGIITSIHSFAQSNIGNFFLAFLLIAVVASVWLIVARRENLKSSNELDSLLSRESSFLFNNLLFVGMSFAIFWGTMFPIISEAVKGVKITVGPPFFNQVNVPIGLAILFLTGVGPLIAWRKASTQNLKKNFLLPSAIGGVSFLALLAAGMRQGYALLSFSLCAFVLATIFSEFIKGAIARRQMTGENYLAALLKLIWRNKGRYGGYIVHVGIVMVFVAITASSAFKIEKDIQLMPGQEAAIGAYKLKYEGLRQRIDRDKEAMAATLRVYSGDKEVWVLKPERRFYRSGQQPTTEVAIRSTLKQDLYAILASWNDDRSANFKFLINPLVVWMWIGGLFLTVGTIIAILPDRRERKARLKGVEACRQDLEARPLERV